MVTKKSKKYSRWSKRIERNILAVYSRANAGDMDYGMHWYSRAHQECVIMAERYGYKHWQAAGVVAAISPGLNWGRNLIEADEVLAADRNGATIPQVGVYGRGNVNKAVRILNGENPLEVFPVKTSPKVRAFYECIINPWNSMEVCIDRHAKGLAYLLTSKKKGFATDDKLSIVRPVEFQYLAWHYRVLAGRLGLIPNQLQAITWVTWKRLEGEIERDREENEVPF